jgi:hypothetical protein
MHKKCNLLLLCLSSNLEVILNGEACEIYASRVSGKYIFATTVKHHKFPEQMVHSRFQVLTTWLMKAWVCDTVSWKEVKTMKLQVIGGVTLFHWGTDSQHFGG